MTAATRAEAAGADLRHVDTWLFDLDNTLYVDGAPFLEAIGDRMTAYVERVTGLPRAEATALQKRYLAEEGATLAGMVRHHGVDAAHFLHEVHDVPVDGLTPSAETRGALGRLPGRRIVFTNGSAAHAERVLARLDLADLFDEVFHLEAMGLLPKPRPEAFERLLRAHAIAPARTLFVEDTAANLAPAKALGMTTVWLAPEGAEAPPFVDHVTADLPAFLLAARLHEGPRP